MAALKLRRRRVKPDAPAHVRGVHEGNHGPIDKNPGLRADGKATAARSTGINPQAENPIDPRMPNLPPP
jgi:hypothetical protein